ncbi:hypothetical protein C8R42DRAFT_722254 [Lentinula raphanica]|nr:hypothetical protein C8R42DRAFT_722254 [Lentinula raphanica]
MSWILHATSFGLAASINLNPEVDQELRMRSTWTVKLTLVHKEKGLSDYPTLDSVVVPLLTYFNILIAYARLGGNPDAGCVLATGAMSYVASLMEMASKYQWAAVFDYHVEYMNFRRYEMKEGNYLGWGPVEGPLYALVVANPRHKHPSRRSNYKPKPPKNQGEYPASHDGAGKNALPQRLDGQHI